MHPNLLSKEIEGTKEIELREVLPIDYYEI